MKTLKLKQSDCDLSDTGSSKSSCDVRIKDDVLKKLKKEGFVTLDEMKLKEFPEFSHINDLEEAFEDEGLPESFFDRINSIIDTFIVNKVSIEIEGLEDWTRCFASMALFAPTEGN